MNKLLALLVPVALSAGCTDEVDISGMYETTYHTRNTGDCDTEGPAVTDDPPYFQIEAAELFGQEYYTFRECSSSSADDCTGFGFFGQSFTEPIDGGWRGEMTLSAYSGDICTLTYAHGQAVLVADTLEVEWRSYSGQVTLGEDDCLDADAAERQDELGCESYDVMVGQPVVLP